MVGHFSVADATLHTATTDELEDGGSEVPVRPVAEFAGNHDELTHPKEDWTCIPLHEEETATLTGSFVAFTEHALHGPICVFEQNGEREFIEVDAFGVTKLADRIRFWHSDWIPETYPPTYDSPIDDNEPARNPIDPDHLIDALLAYVENERDATRATNRDSATQQSPSIIYDSGGDAIPSINPRGKTDNGTFQFRVDLPSHLESRRDGDWAFFIESEFGIHEGNEVLLHECDGTDAADRIQVQAEVTRIRGLNIWLTLDWASVDNATQVGNALTDGATTYGVSALLNPVPFDREREAIEELREHPFRAVLAGTRPITFSNGAAAQSEQLDAALNQEQQLAVEHALLADDLFCIHGPPGTGKTRTLIEIVRRAAAAGESVLVCADSNQAIDNLLIGTSTTDDPDPRSLHAHGQHGDGEFTLTRLNASHSDNSNVRRWYSDVPGHPNVVAATNSTAATTTREFDLVVLDEATQSTATASCIPLARADRAVLAGDHRQLPPFSARDGPPESAFGHSLFEHLYATGGVYEGVGLQLQTQYRMHRDIASFSNKAFYDRSLRNGRTVAPLSDRAPVEGYNIGGAVETIDHSKANPTEARLVTHLVTELCEELPPEEIGVITPYTAQVSQIREMLATNLEDADGVTVDTIDSFQGSERTAIVLSLVRSNADGDLGFLGRAVDGPRRLNVALTRAKRYCAIVADWHTLRYETDEKSNSLYRELYQHFETKYRIRTVDPDFLPV